jgi:hypothetical protein
MLMDGDIVEQPALASVIQGNASQEICSFYCEKKKEKKRKKEICSAIGPLKKGDA